MGGVARFEQVRRAKKNEAYDCFLQAESADKATVKNSLQNVRRPGSTGSLFSQQPVLKAITGFGWIGMGAAAKTWRRGRFDQAGRTMLGVVNRLTDVLLFDEVTLRARVICQSSTALGTLVSPRLLEEKTVCESVMSDFRSIERAQFLNALNFQIGAAQCIVKQESVKESKTYQALVS